MILSFKTKWDNGNLTHFVPKIWESICKEDNWLFYEYLNFTDQYLNEFGDKNSNEIFGNFQETTYTPKEHTIRAGSRWKAGMKIHFAINPRSKNYFQFAPILEVKSVQKVVISKSSKYKCCIIDNGWHWNTIDGNNNKMSEFVQNDGFKDIDSFFEFFFPNNKTGTFEGQIIHWTNLRY